MAELSSNGRSSIETTGSKHRSSIWAGALSIFILLVIASLRMFGNQLYQTENPTNLEQIPKDIPIFCLAGGKGRIEAALAYYSQGWGSKLYIIGAGKKSTASNLIRAKAQDIHIPEERIQNIQVETDSRNTIENAFAVSLVVEENPQIKKIILLTSGYHMRRAKFIIEQQLHRKVEIIALTPQQEGIDANNWWHTWLGIQVTLVEYVKFLFASFLIPQLGST